MNPQPLPRQGSALPLSYVPVSPNSNLATPKVKPTDALTSSAHQGMVDKGGNLIKITYIPNGHFKDGGMR